MLGQFNMKSGEELANFCSLSVIINTKCYQNMKSFKKASISQIQHLKISDLLQIVKHLSYTDRGKLAKGICDQSENLLHWRVIRD